MNNTQVIQKCIDLEADNARIKHEVNKAIEWSRIRQQGGLIDTLVLKRLINDLKEIIE